MGIPYGDTTSTLSPIFLYKLVGKPVPLQRPRFSQQHVYDPQKEEKEDAQLQLKLQHKKKPLLEGPLELNITFFMAIPQALSKKKRAQFQLQPHHIKPDLSNLLKFVEDVAEGILYKDDKTISLISARKLYDTTPRTIFTLQEIGGK